MSFTYVNGLAQSGSAQNVSFNYGVSAAENNILFMYVNKDDDTTAIDLPIGGSTWTELVNEIPSGETSRQALFWKVAGAAEPTSYNVGLNAVRSYHMVLKEFSVSGGTASIKHAALGAIDTTQTYDAIASAGSGRAVVSGDLSLIFAGKDRGVTGETWTAVDGGFTNILGSGEDRECAAAHKIHSGSETLGNITFTSSTSSGTSQDSTYSIHITLETSASPMSVSIDNSTPEPGNPVVLTISNGTAPYTVTIDGVSITETSQNATTFSFNAFDPLVFDNKTRLFNQAYTVEVTDSGASTATTSITITPTHQFQLISGMPPPQDSILTGSGAINGDYFHARWTQNGNNQIFPADGDPNGLDLPAGQDHITAVAVYSDHDSNGTPYWSTEATWTFTSAIVLEGDIVTNTLLSGNLSITYGISGSTSGETSSSANMGYLYQIGGGVSSESVLTAILSVINLISGSTSGETTFTANLQQGAESTLILKGALRLTSPNDFYLR